ncbi:MAG: GNAT family N-acetyltransferase [Anaerolineae bacterium]|nr:GNAT family N-acetyltransferase [Anaerolineae bacterium]
MMDWQTERIRLRGLEPADWLIFYEWNQESDMPRAMDFVWFPQSQDAVRAWAQRETMNRGEDDRYFFVIETLNGEVVGMINSHSIDRRCGTFSYGVGIRPAYQRKGYASEAIILFCRHFFHERRYQKVIANVFSFNAASMRLHERLGFQLEGRLRRMIYTRGQYFNQIYYGMTVEEFDERYGG